MKRRDFIALAGGAATAWPLAARAQQPAKVPLIGLLSAFSPSDTALWDKAFLQGLRDHGWIDGKNIRIEFRFAEGKDGRLPDLAAGLVAANVSVIVTSVTPDTLAAKNATKQIPIVMVAVGDPVAVGIVESLARPGGNITGLSQMTPDVVGKRLELLKEIAPKTSSVFVFFNSDDPNSVLGRNEIQRSAQRLEIDAHALDVRNAADLEKALQDAAAAHAGAIAMMPNPVFVTNSCGSRISRYGTKFPRCSTCGNSRTWAVCCHTAWTGPTFTGAQPVMSTRY